MKVRAQKEIKKGEEITTRYLGPWEGQPGRQIKIQRNWQFICNCLRCQDPSDLATYFSAIKCKNCSVTFQNNQNCDIYNSDLDSEPVAKCGYLLPINPQVLGSPWKCQSCDTIVTVTEIDDMLQKTEKMVDSMKSEILRCLKKDLFESVQSIELVVNKLHELVHPNHFLVFQFKKWVLKLPLSAQAPSSNKISFLELQMRFHSAIMKIVDTLDPGLTLNRASHHKDIAQCRIQLSKQKVFDKIEGYSKVQHMNQMKIAMSELKEVSASFKYPEKIVCQ